MSNNEKLNWISPFLLLLTSAWMAVNGIDLQEYMVFFLLLLANGQMRIHTFRGKTLILSVIAELILIFFLGQRFGGMSYMLVYIPMLDTLRFLSEERFLLTPFSLGVVIYLLVNRELEVIILNIALFLIFIMLILTVEKLHKSLLQLENNYDKNRNYSYQLEESKERLEKYNKNIERLAQMEERNRISREIHDSLGHKLTATLLQLEAVIRTSELNQSTKEMLNSVRDNLSSSIDTLRKTVKNISGNSSPVGINSIKKLALELQQSTQVEVQVELKGAVRKLYPSIELTIYKNVQEAMTNAIRHGMCNSIHIVIEYTLKEVIFSVTNDGIPCREVKMGMGLTGMKERTELVGGNLKVNSHLVGFEVTGIIPIMGEVV